MQRMLKAACICKRNDKSDDSDLLYNSTVLYVNPQDALLLCDAIAIGEKVRGRRRRLCDLTMATASGYLLAFATCEWIG
jgi:hypothetical protein